MTRIIQISIKAFKPILLQILLLGILISSCSSKNSLYEKSAKNVSSDINNDQFVVETSFEGFYEICLEDLPGFSPGSTEFNKEDIFVTRKGNSEPFWVVKRGEKQYIRFFSSENNSIYNKTHRTIISFSDPSIENHPLSSHATRIEKYTITRDDPDTYIRMAFEEKNNVFQPMVQDGDHWLWLSLAAPSQQIVEIDSPILSNGPVELRISLWAATEAPQNPDHEISFSINNWDSGAFSWDGKGYHTIQFTVPEGIIKDSSNQLTISATGTTGAAADVVWLNGFSFSFPEAISRESRQFSFIGDGEVYDFSDIQEKIDIYELGPNGFIQLIYDNNNPPNEWNGVKGNSYWVIQTDGYFKPDTIRKFQSSPDLKSIEEGFDYLVIVPDEWIKTISPYIDYRKNQGMSPLAVPLEAIYDQFNFGYPEPEGIRNFLQHAVRNWITKPQFVFLIGDYTFDPRMYQTDEKANRLPSFFIWSEFGGQTVSDLGFSQVITNEWPVDNDSIDPGIPQIAVGRLPVRSSEELKNYLKKVVTYEEGERFNKRILVVSDGQDGGFKQDSDNFIKLQNSYSYDQFAASPNIVNQNNELVKSWINDYSFIVYFGHGSLSQWGKDQIFSSEDVKNLIEDNSAPILVQMTCLTGFFIHPKISSLSEELLLKQDGGAIATLSPTSLTLPEDQYFLVSALGSNLGDTRNDRLGLLILKSLQQAYETSPDSMDVLRTFLLLGDPAILMPGIKESQSNR